LPKNEWKQQRELNDLSIFCCAFSFSSSKQAAAAACEGKAEKGESSMAEEIPFDVLSLNEINQPEN